MLTPTQRLMNRLLTLRNRHFFGLDLLLLSFSPWLAFAICTDGLSTQPDGWDLLAGFGVGLVTYTLIALVVRLLVFHGFGLYRRYWRYASIEELDLIAWAVFISTAILVSLVFLVRLPQVAVMGFPLWNFPRSVVLIDGLLVLILVGGAALQRAPGHPPPTVRAEPAAGACHGRRRRRGDDRARDG